MTSRRSFFTRILSALGLGVVGKGACSRASGQVDWPSVLEHIKFNTFCGECGRKDCHGACGQISPATNPDVWYPMRRGWWSAGSGEAIHFDGKEAAA